MTPAGRFYGAGLLVCALMLFTAATWFAAQSGSARPVAATAFAAGLAIGVLVVLLLAGRENSGLRQDRGGPGNRLFWRLAIGAVLVAVFDEALSGVPVFVATGFMTGVIGSILVDALRRTAG